MGIAHSTWYRFLKNARESWTSDGTVPKPAIMDSEMDLLPVRTVPLVSALPPAALADLLRGVIGEGAAVPLAGSVASDGFVVTRVKEYRSTSMPLMRGRFVALAGGGTVVRLSLRPPRIVLAFMGIWLGFLAAVAALIVGARALDAGRSLLPLLAPAGLAALAWFLMVSVAAAEGRWALERLVEAAPALRRSATGEFRN